MGYEGYSKASSLVLFSVIRSPKESRRLSIRWMSCLSSRMSALRSFLMLSIISQTSMTVVSMVVATAAIVEVAINILSFIAYSRREISCDQLQ